MNELLDNYFAGKITYEEKRRLFSLLDTDEILKKEFHQMQNAIALTGMMEHSGDAGISKSGKKRFMQILFRRKAKKVLMSSMKYAAVMFLLVCGAYFIAKQQVTEEFSKNYTVITAPKGQRVKVDLPDGTIAWLSPCSKLRYSSSFNNLDRNIELDGSTFFDVAKNPEKPFIVSAKNYRIEVLGTKFNIFAYSASPEFETDLVEGAVHIYDTRDKQIELFLQPHEKAVLYDDKLVKRRSEFNNESYLKNGVVSFQSEAFGRVINSISLWNGVKFTIEPTVDATKLISGKFRQSDTVESILKALQGATAFHYKMVSEEEIVIY